jgi:hypothetical protein
MSVRHRAAATVAADMLLLRTMGAEADRLLRMRATAAEAGVLIRPVVAEAVAVAEATAPVAITADTADRDVNDL